MRVFARVLLQKMIGQQQHVRLALAQGRHEDRENIQAVVEVLPELSLIDRPGKIFVRSGHQTHVDLERFGPTQSLKFPLL